MAEQQALVGYNAVTGQAAFYVPKDGGRFRLVGPEAQEYLHRMITNDLKSLAPGQGAYACLLDINGRMIADLWAWVVSDEEILVETAAATCDATMANLDKYLIMEDVEIQDARADVSLMTVQGPRAVEALSHALAMELPNLEPGCLWQTSNDGTGIIVAARDRTGHGGVDVYTPGKPEALVAALRETGVSEASAETMETLRVEAGIPLWGAELTPDTIPLEANLEGTAVSFTKGCYPGQEIIARIHSRGKPARHLAGIRFDSRQPAVGASVLVDGQSVGVITSVANSPTYGYIALAYLKKGSGVSGTHVSCDGVTGQTTDLPFGRTT